MMTRKDYVETARILAGVRESILSLGVEGEDILLRGKSFFMSLLVLFFLAVLILFISQ